MTFRDIYLLGMKFKKIKDGTCIKRGGGGRNVPYFFCQNQKLSGHSETQKTHTYLLKRVQLVHV